VVLDCDLGGNCQSLEKMVVTIVVNYTQKMNFLKEGNGNLTFAYMVLEPNNSEKLSIDCNATY